MAIPKDPEYLRAAMQAPLRSTWDSRQEGQALAADPIQNQDVRRNERRRIKREQAMQNY